MVHLDGGTAYAQTRLVAPAVFFFVGIRFALGIVYAAWRTAGAAASRSSAGQGRP
jgi:hypothetical protein